MELLDRIEAVIDHPTGAPVFDWNAPAIEGSASRWAGQARQYLFWLLANGDQAVRQLLLALRSGVVPILLPARTPRPKIERLRATFPAFGCFDGQTVDWPAEPAAAPPDVLLCLATSGSTGAPRILAAGESGLIHGIDAIHKAQGLADVADTGVMLPLAYSFALVNQLLWALVHRRRLHFLPGMGDPAGTLAAIDRQGIEMLCLVPDQVRALVRLGFAGRQVLDAVKVVNLAGGPFPVDCHRQLAAMFPNARLFNNYGCTEAMPRLTAVKVMGPNHPVTLVGGPIEGVTLRIAGDSQAGPIEFRSKAASMGTVDPDGTLVPHPRWIRSGDLGRLEDGALHVMGRYDQVLKLGGERISLIEIEQALRSSAFDHVVAWSEREAGEAMLVAVAHGAAPPPGPDILRHLRNGLPRAMWPRRIYWSEEWPLLPNGKVDRQALAERARSDALACIYSRTA